MANQCSGYTEFPQKLATLDPYGFDAAFYNDRLRSESMKLFVASDDALDIGVLDIPSGDVGTEDRRPKDLTTSQSFEEVLERRQGIRDRFYFLRPSNPKVFSWCQLHISENFTRKLLATHQVMPAFLDCLHSSGEKLHEVDSTYGKCKHQIHFSPNGDGPRREIMKSFEICYNISYVANNGRGVGLFSWSVRQMSVYQQYQVREGSNTWILVKASPRVTERATEASNFRGRELLNRNPLNMHLIFLSSAEENWRAYRNALEEYFLDSTMNAVSYPVHSKLDYKHGSLQLPRGSTPPPGDSLKVDFGHVQKLQKFEEAVHRFKSYLENNEAVINCLRDLNDRYHKFSGQNDSISLEMFNSALESHLAELATQKRNVDSLLRRVHGRSRLLYNVLEFQTSETVARHGEFTADLQSKARRETAIMVEMSRKTARDSVTVKIVTLLALLYLPLTCVTAFMQCGIVRFADSKGEAVDFNSNVMFSKEGFLFFLALTIALMIITVGACYLWRHMELTKRWMKKSGLQDVEKLGELKLAFAPDRKN